jgi:hypothetical protein
MTLNTKDLHHTVSKPNPNDISIGQAKWITFIDIADRPYEQAVSIDHLIAPMGSFWSALESNCVAGCCGIDAFSLWAEDIKSASLSQARQALSSALTSLRTFAEQSTADTFVSSRLNNLFDKQVLLQLIEHIQKYIA